MDTAAGACSVAVWATDRVVEKLEPLHRGHAEALMPMVVATLAEAACSFADLDAVAVTVGPGGFTGVRIGLAAARGLALAAGLPCFGVTTLAALAEQAGRLVPAGWPLLVVIDSKRDDLYAQVFLDGQATQEPGVATADSLAQAFAGKQVTVAGDGAALVMPSLFAAGAEVKVVPGPGYPAARHVGAIAARRLAAGEHPPEPPAPLYLRAPATGPGTPKPRPGAQRPSR